MKQLKCKFANFGIQGFGAEVLRVCLLVHYCKVNGIDFYMSEDDDWKLTPEKNGNWRSFFTSLNMTTDDMPEVTDDITVASLKLSITFKELSDIVKEVFQPQSKYDLNIIYDIDPNLSFNNEYAAIHVRRGDKVTGKWKEGLKHELNDYYKKIEGRYEKKQVFVITDSPEVAKEAQEEGYLVDDSEVRRESYSYILSESDLWTDKEKEDEALVFFKNMKLFKNASQLVGSNNSNYYMLGQLLRGKEGISLSENLVYKSNIKMDNTIKTYVINLPRREDRRNKFIENNKHKIVENRQYKFFSAFDAKGKGLTYDELRRIGYDTNQTWKDPQDGQHLSVGGIGCFISHFELWEKCIELDHPIMILEDDVIIEDEFNYQELVDLVDEGYNLIYPGYAEQGTAKPIEGKTGLVVPEYAYWASSYVITPDAAKILVNDEIKQNIIPVDEYITTKLPELNPIGYEKRIIHQIPKDGTSDVDPHWGRDRNYFQDFNVHSFNNNGEQSLAEFVDKLPDNDVVIYYADESKFKKYVENEIGRKFLYTNCDIIRGEDDAFMPNLVEGKEDFNSEVYTARVSRIKQTLNPIKKYVINLKHREDRKEVFENNNSKRLGEYEFTKAVNGHQVSYNELKENGYDVKHDWIDPILETPLTKGEVGCFMSHYSLWVECIEKDQPCIIFEDDAVVTDRFNEIEIQSVLSKGYNFIYLGWKEMEESENVDDTFVIPKYPYWGLAYVITPDAAKVLVNGEIEQNIIPVDEYLPTMMDKLNPIAYKENVVNARSREDGGSNINPSSPYDYFIDFNVHAITVGTDESKCSKLYESAAYSYIKFTNLGKGKNWEGGVMERGKGGGHKINLIREHLNTLPENDVVLFCDGYDVFVNDNINEFTVRYLSFKKKVVFAAEQYCWPDNTLAESMEQLTLKQHGGYDTPYKYLNSGVFMGRVSELKRIVDSGIVDNDDDQLYYQKKWLSEEYDIIIDTDCYMFQCHEPEVSKGDNGMLYNPRTQCYNLLYHGNGGEDAKTKFNELYSSFYASSSPIVYIPTHKYLKLKDNMLLIDFLTPSMCDSIIELSEANGCYKNDEGDAVPGQELRLHEIGLSEKLAFHWEKCVAPILNEEFYPCDYYGIRDAFIIKYTMEGQRDLRLHSDASLVTGSIKLNDDYTGGELYFPRQDFSNKDIPVGTCILFPGQVTHPHTSQLLKSGTKYSLTIWTKRTHND